MFRPVFRPALALAALLAPLPALAGVQAVTERGFVVRYVAEVPASADETWETLIAPAKWWSKAHTYSGDSRNMTIDLRPGGCFCEILPSTVSPNAAPRGGVEHMRVVYVERGRALRMVGGLGPLQSDAATGVMTVMLKPAGAGTRILLEYTVGGYFRTEPRNLAPLVDQMLTEQVTSLAQKLGGKLVTVSEPASEPAREQGAGPSEPVPAPTAAPREPMKGDRIGEIIGH
ncbi:SRPBCC family protein [Novosphingobium album (ex Liu et al. 2023)]|uniref:SRPBCC family protein n=1 Tax=Novosphingobium album (ex Liu et al. 2023) TaxID=3031130 RepID=A0ABT5WMV4_9SPHN|nr:SRPBCC family protein [Novosphingobium album (ex Liu et al. 2023)]MDE8651381.1 SRPBCC family protein [Novosphingobium album (ex Liu et al. 2023)]